MTAILLIPLYTRALTIDEFGQLELALAAQALIVILSGMQIESAVAVDFHFAKSRNEQAVLAATSCALTVAGSLLSFIVLAGLAASGCLSTWLSPGIILLIGALTLPTQLLGIQFIILRFDNRAKTYALLSFFDLALSSLITFVFLVVFHWGVAGALTGILASKCLCVLILWTATFGHYGSPDTPLVMFSASWARRLTSYGIPSIPAVVLNWFQNAGSRLILAGLLPLSSIAIIGVSLKTAAIFGFFIYSLRLAWEPISIAHLDKHTSQPLFYRQSLEWFVIVVYFTLAVALVSSPWIVTLLAPPMYSNAVESVFFMLTAQYWIGFSNMTIIGIHGSRQTSKLLPIFGLGALANVIILFITARSLGPLAAALGLLSGTIISALLSAYFSNKVFNTNFSRRLILTSLVSTCALPVIFYLMLIHLGNPTANNGNIPSWVGLGLLLSFSGGLLLAGFGIGFSRCREMFIESYMYFRKASASL